MLASDPLAAGAAGSLWQWLGQLPDPRDRRGVRFTLPCVIAVAMAAKAVTRSETVLILTTASPEQGPPADLLALNRGHWAATEATHYIRDADLKEDSSRARAPGAARFMATVGNATLNLLRTHGVTNIAAERRRLNGSDRQILSRMGLSTG